MNQPARYWPNFCYDPASCERNRRCMYVKCKHEGFDISTQIDVAVAREADMAAKPSGVRK